MAASTSLKRARGLESYTLGGDEQHGIVHALATSCGTKLWPTRLVRRFDFLPPRETSALPPGVTYRISRVKDGVASTDDETYPGQLPLKEKCHGLFDVDMSEEGDETLTTAADCMLASGVVLIRLPLQLRASHFRIGFGNCGKWQFSNWVFEAYSENENVWHTLYDSGGESPWADEYGEYGTGRLTVFPVDCSFGASQFRIRLDYPAGQCQCMHIRGFELYGKILPPWRID